MTVREKLFGMLVNYGMFEKQAESVMQLAIPVLERETYLIDGDINARINRKEVDSSDSELPNFIPVSKASGDGFEFYGAYKMRYKGHEYEWASFEGKSKGFAGGWEKCKGLDVDKSKLTKPYQITFDRPASEYPDIMYVLWFKTIRPVALKWIDENIPAAWYREMFVGE